MFQHFPFCSLAGCNAEAAACPSHASFARRQLYYHVLAFMKVT